MASRDYTQEIGIPSHKKTFPRPVAYAILVIVAIGVSFGVKEVLSEAKDRHAAEKTQSAPAAPK